MKTSNEKISSGDEGHSNDDVNREEVTSSVPVGQSGDRISRRYEHVHVCTYRSDYLISFVQLNVAAFQINLKNFG